MIEGADLAVLAPLALLAAGAALFTLPSLAVMAGARLLAVPTRRAAEHRRELDAAEEMIRVWLQSRR